MKAIFELTRDVSYETAIVIEGPDIKAINTELRRRWDAGEIEWGDPVEDIIIKTGEDWGE